MRAFPVFIDSRAEFSLFNDASRFFLIQPSTNRDFNQFISIRQIYIFNKIGFVEQIVNDFTVWLSVCPFTQFLG